MRDLVCAASLVLLSATTAIGCIVAKPAQAKQTAAAGPQAVEGYFNGADGVRLFYRKLGSGKDVAVFVHGGPGAGMYDGGCDMEPLARGRTIILYDQRGGGRSELVTDPKLLTASHHVRDLEALRRHFGLERMTLIALSWGTGLSTLYTAEHPERVRRLLLIAPMPPAWKPYGVEREEKIVSLLSKETLARRQEIQRSIPVAAADEAESLCRELRKVALPYRYKTETGRVEPRCDRCDSPPAAIRNQPAVARATHASLGEWDFRPLLARFRVPVLIVEGEKTVVPHGLIRAWAEAIPGSRLLLIPEAGH